MHVRAKWRYYQPLCDFVTSWQLGLTRTDIHICANLSTLDRNRFLIVAATNTILMLLLLLALLMLLLLILFGYVFETRLKKKKM